ncbi:MAG TPA: SHOCT domain-containing protein [Acidimicrobiales bacterium]
MAAAAPAAGVDITGELTKLAEMRSNGLLTDEEFAAAKAKLLA